MFRFFGNLQGLLKMVNIELSFRDFPLKTYVKHFFIADLVCYFLLTFNLTNIVLGILQLSLGF